jgi:Cu/Ag efflux protein CusF
MNRSLMIVLLACGLLSVGCQTKAPKHYAISGEVISLDVPKDMITVKHGEIPGLMPAMTMDYKVADVRQIERLSPGDTISADLVVGENIGHLEKIELLVQASPPKATQVK